MALTIRVLHVGMGPIGAAIARQMASRRGMRTVGAVDIDPSKVGRDVGDVTETGRRLRVKVTADLQGAVKTTRADVAVLCTSSSLAAVIPQIEQLLRFRIPIVSTTEELAYPVPPLRRLTGRIDELAKRAKVAVLGTGVNPGFVMDALPIALSAACEYVERVEVCRLQDARERRLSFQEKIGAGLTPRQFAKGVAAGRVRHVGFAQSIYMLADAFGWRLTRVTGTVHPWIAEEDVASEQLAVSAGYVSGLSQEGIGYVGRDAKIRLQLDAYLGAPETFDSVLIEGSPRIYSKVDGGVHGDVATAAMVVNAVPRVLAAAPGLRTMRDMPLPSFSGTV